jgi:hypothetical protein
MLKKITLAVVLTSGLMGGMAYAGALAGTGINGSMHDMNNTVTGHTDDKMLRSCVFCHTPHNASATTVGVTAPLWNRADTTLTFAQYGWVAPANFAGANMTIMDGTAGPTKLCLSCHDGSIAADSHRGTGAGNNSAVAGTLTLTSANHAYVRDLTVTHPIGFKYSDAYAARGAGQLVPETSGFIDGTVANTALLTTGAQAGFNTNSRAALTLTTTKIADTLYSGVMTCATCHDVHNSVNAKPAAGSPTYNYFIRAQEEGSAICLSCHVK